MTTPTNSMLNERALPNASQFIGQRIDNVKTKLLETSGAGNLLVRTPNVETTPWLMVAVDDNRLITNITVFDH
jgi:hypothetical protein